MCFEKVGRVHQRVPVYGLAHEPDLGRAPFRGEGTTWPEARNTCLFKKISCIYLFREHSFGGGTEGEREETLKQTPVE